MPATKRSDRDPSRCVSVIVPAKDAAATIATTLHSLAPEHAVVGQLILADDRSDDGTAEIAASAAAAADLPLT